MMWRDVINLVTLTYTKNELKDSISHEDKKQVFANKKDVRQSEFYQAMGTGLRPELMFEVRTIEYDGQSELEYPVGSNKKYTIIRTFSRNGEITELICSGLVGES